MKARAASAFALASLGFGVASAILAGSAYVNVVEARAAAPVVRVLRIDEGTVPDPAVPGYPALPNADHLPASFTEQQREDATIWLQQKAYVDECMADAGYPEWFYLAPWQTRDSSLVQWNESYSAYKRTDAFLALYGRGASNGPVTPADYKWEQGGCDGQAWHKVGIDWPVVY